MQRIRRTLAQPRSTYAVLAPLLVLCWFLSGVGGGNDGASPDDGASYYVGAFGWALFCILLLATVVYTVVVLVRQNRRATT